MTQTIVAVFDFDGTLTYGDSLVPFLQYLVGPKKFYLGLLSVSPFLIGYALKLVSNQKAKEVLIGHFLRGKSETELELISQKFALEKIPKILRPEAKERLQWHQSQGHRTILISASLELYLSPWAKSMGFEKVLGTELEKDGSFFTGRFQSKNCYGLEKVRRLEKFLGDLNQYCLYAYGDSKGDLYLLKLAKYAYYRTFKSS